MLTAAMTDLTLVSLFDGIGGFPLAFQRAGVRVTATVEIDQPAAAITARHFPDAAHFPDVTKVTADELRAVGFVPERGIVTAGWPCQDFSVAGRRAGLDGARSGLWWEVVRVLAELRPAWFIGENVPGLLSSLCQCGGDHACVANGHRTRCDGEPHEVKPTGCCVGGCMETHGGAMGSVLGSLAELGYGVAYRILDAQHFGVPQQRRRVVIVGHFGTPWSAPAAVLLEPESGDGNSAAGWAARPNTAGGTAAGIGAVGGDISASVTAKSRKWVAALTSSGVGTCGADDNQAQAGHIICVTGGMTHTLTSEGADASEDGTGRGTPIVVHAVHENQRGEITTPDVMGTLKTGGGKPGQGYPCIVHPAVAAPLSAGSSGDGVNSPGRRGEDDHNLVALDLRNAARESGAGAGTQGDGICEGGPSYSLSATERAIPGVATETVVRRLTELECERLQGYPDQWTDGQSGSARYRQLGNSIAVPVFEWLAHRIVAFDAEVR